MTTNRTADAPPASTGTSPTAESGRGPLTRVVAASVATGGLLMFVLTVGVAGGAPEYAITAAALLAGGLGWATLAALADRLTDRPQRWACVPAVAMVATGAALLATSPDDARLTTAGWVWPPLLLALTVWTGRQAWLHLTRGGRWLVVPVLAALLLTSFGGAYEAVALARDTRTASMPGRLYDVGGYRLHLSCTGSGGPTVVLSSGMGEMSPYWARVVPAVAGTTRVCAYDRAGQGWSDSSPHAADGTRIARDLHTLLEAADEPGPFVLAGHSSGGVYALTYAAAYPESVAGVVLLDSSSPRQVERVPSFVTTSAVMRRGLALMPTMARTGLGQLAPPSTTLPSPEAAQAASFGASPRGLSNVREEQGQLQTAMRQAQALTTLGDTPLVVLSSQDELSNTPGWGEAQDELAALSSNSSHGVLDITHAAVLDDPTSAAASAQAIRDVVQSVRTNTAVPPR